MPALLRPCLPAIALLVGLASLLSTGTASAQIPQPPTTFYGSVTDAAGRVPAGVPVTAIVNNNICGEATTMQVGEGNSLVTMYVIDVISDRQTSGCGKPGDAVRLRVGDRLAEEAVEWAGTGELVQFDLVFGGATPDVIPTATRTPTPSATAETASTAAGSPGSEATPGGTQSPSRTEIGGVSTTTPAAPDSGDSGGDGGFPVWALLALAVGAIAAIGGGIGFAISRGSRSSEAATTEPPFDA